MAPQGTYQSNLIPKKSEWANLPYQVEHCGSAIERAAAMMSSDDALRDINRRLGINVDEIPVALAYVGRVDANGRETGQPNYPAFALDPSICAYLNLDPNISEVRFRWTLGVFNDLQMGPIPILFLVTRLGSEERCIALVWSLAKERDREHFGYLLQGRFMADTTERGMEGGFAQIYQVGFVVDGQNGGLDLLAGSYIIPWKTWNTLAMSVYLNAAATAFTNTAMPWPYPTDMSEDGIFGSPAGSSQPSWY